MAFTITCDFCEEHGHIEFEKGSIFMVCDNCGQEREIIKHNTYLTGRLELIREQRDIFKEMIQQKGGI